MAPGEVITIDNYIGVNGPPMVTELRPRFFSSSLRRSAHPSSMLPHGGHPQPIDQEDEMRELR